MTQRSYRCAAYIWMWSSKGALSIIDKWMRKYVNNSFINLLHVDVIMFLFDDLRYTEWPIIVLYFHGKRCIFADYICCLFPSNISTFDVKLKVSNDCQAPFVINTIFCRHNPIYVLPDLISICFGVKLEILMSFTDQCDPHCLQTQSTWAMFLNFIYLLMRRVTIIFNWWNCF